METKHTLTHNVREGRYEFTLEDGTLAYVEYIEKPGNILVLTHTFVPSKFEGRGIGSQLARAVLDDVSRRQLKIVPQCRFIARWIYTHPQWEKIIAKEETHEEGAALKGEGGSNVSGLDQVKSEGKDTDPPPTSTSPKNRTEHRADNGLNGQPDEQTGKQPDERTGRLTLTDRAPCSLSDKATHKQKSRQVLNGFACFQYKVQQPRPTIVARTKNRKEKAMRETDCSGIGMGQRRDRDGTGTK